MSIAKGTSRFDILPDDAGDPFETASKKNRKKNSGSGDDSKKKANKKGNANTDRKQLQSLAFGSASEGKKKSKGSPQNHNQNGNVNNSNNNGSSAKEANSTNGTEVGSGTGGAPKEKKMTGNLSTEKKGTSQQQRPKGLSNEQWEQWQKRDADTMDEAYATDLQTALLQSKLEYETEQKNKPVTGKGKKKKPVAVPLSEFQARLEEGGSVNPNHVMNGGGGGLNFGLSNHNPNYQMMPQSQVYETDEDLVERFRQEARLELERERRRALEQQLLMSRPPPPPIERPTALPASRARSENAAAAGLNTSPVSGDEKDLLITRLTEENLRLKEDVHQYKERVKTINRFLEAAQEVKDKAKLIYDLENMTKANNDLQEQLRQVHSQLEQEKSRSSAAMLELRRLLENRRRTATEGSN